MRYDTILLGIAGVIFSPLTAQILGMQHFADVPFSPSLKIMWRSVHIWRIPCLSLRPRDLDLDLNLKPASQVIHAV